MPPSPPPRLPHRRAPARRHARTRSDGISKPSLPRHHRRLSALRRTRPPCPPRWPALPTASCNGCFAGAGSDCLKTKCQPSSAFPTASALLQTGRGRTKPTPTSNASFRIWANPKPCASSPKPPQPQPMPRRRTCRGCIGTASSPLATTSTRTTPPRSKPPYNQVSRRRKPACKA